MRTQIAATHRVELGGEIAFVNGDNFTQVCDRLVAKHGGTPVVVDLVKAVALPAVEAIPAVVERAIRAAATAHVQAAVVEHKKELAIAPGELDAVGRDRSNATRFEMQANGFAPQAPIYAVGSRVNETGVENATASRREYDQLPLVGDACHQLCEVVENERRVDVVADRLCELRMLDDGRLQGTAGKAPLPLTEQAFGGFLSRSAIGGHSYLSKCPPELRALNVNHWLQDLKFNERADEIKAIAGRGKFEPRDVKLRTRLNGDQREIFAVVSTGYGAFDADKIASALRLAAPQDARGKVVYDGTRLKAEVLFHTNVAPKDFVAGEFFKAGVLIRSDDTGSGAIRISAVVWQNLCLNLIILDECVQEIAAIRHVGSVEALAKKFTEGFQKALGTIDGFLGKWDYAVNENVFAAIEGMEDVRQYQSLRVSEVLPGLFNGIIERELVRVPGQRKDVVKGLMRMFDEDTSSARQGKDVVTRAAVVNAFTRYAHAVNRDAFVQDDIERQAGGLLNVTRANRVLPYEPFSF